jgi:hypothetical protein
LYKDIDLNIVVVKEGEKLQRIMSGLIGNLGKVIAPHYLVITSELKAGYMENVGYTVEKIVLKLTAMGVATCWLGGHVKEFDLKEVIGIPKDHEYIVMVSIGYPMDEENFFRKSPEDAKRKAISEFSSGSSDEIWQECLKAVRIAPSAANTQPWRFIIQDSKAHIFCEGPSNFITKKLFGDINVLDVGIALSHLEIAANKLGKKVSFAKDSQVGPSLGQYITTVELT